MISSTLRRKVFKSINYILISIIIAATLGSIPGIRSVYTGNAERRKGLKIDLNLSPPAESNEEHNTLGSAKRKKKKSAENDIEWNSFENVTKVPSLESHPSSINENQSAERLPEMQALISTETEEGKSKSFHDRQKLGKPYQKLLHKMDLDPEFAKKKKAQRVEATRRFRDKAKVTLTPEEKIKERNNKREIDRQYYHRRKERFGTYGNANTREIQRIRQNIKFGVASTEELRFFHEFRQKANEAAKKSYHKKVKKAGQ